MNALAAAKGCRTCWFQVVRPRVSRMNHPVHTELKRILVASGCLAKPLYSWIIGHSCVLNPVVNALGSLLTSDKVKGRSSSNASYAHAHACGLRGM